MNLKKLFALTAPTAAVGMAWVLYGMRPATAVLWMLGIALGIALHRSRFCVAAGFRDSVLFHDAGPARAILLALALSTFSFGWLQHAAQAAREPLPGNLYPISAATITGATLFGIGLVPAGGCACSTLLRLGEGHVRFLWTLGGLILGSLGGAYHFGWWEQLIGQIPALHLPALVGWPVAIGLNMALLGALALLLTWWEKRGWQS